MILRVVDHERVMKSRGLLIVTYAIPLDLVSSGLPQSQFLTNIISVLLALYGAKHSSLYVCGIEL